MKTVAAITHTWNQHPRYLDGAVQSALNQVRPPDQIIVVDDGSDTPVVHNGWPEDRVKILRTPHRGISHAVNAGARFAQCDYLAALPSDDEWKPWKLDLQLDAMRLAGWPEASFTAYEEVPATPAGDGRFVYDVSRVQWLPPWADAQLAKHGRIVDCTADNCVYGGARIVARDAWLALGGFREDLRWVNDWHFHARVAATFGWHYYPRPLTTRHVLPSGMWADAARQAPAYTRERSQVARELRCGPDRSYQNGAG